MNNTCRAETSAQGQEIIVCKPHAREVLSFCLSFFFSLFIHFGEGEGKKRQRGVSEPSRCATLVPASSSWPSGFQCRDLKQGWQTWPNPPLVPVLVGWSVQLGSVQHCIMTSYQDTSRAEQV